MALFGAMQVSGSAMTVFRTWMDSIADNLANMQTVQRPGEDPFRAKLVIAESVSSPGAGTGGVRVREILAREVGTQPDFDPEHPYADENGLVYYPGIDMGVEMTHLLAAQRGYQANITAIQRARDAYQAALRLGR